MNCVCQAFQKQQDHKLQPMNVALRQFILPCPNNRFGSGGRLCEREGPLILLFLYGMILRSICQGVVGATSRGSWPNPGDLGGRTVFSHNPGACNLFEVQYLKRQEDKTLNLKKYPAAHWKSTTHSTTMYLWSLCHKNISLFLGSVKHNCNTCYNCNHNSLTYQTIMIHHVIYYNYYFSICN